MRSLAWLASIWVIDILGEFAKKYARAEELPHNLQKFAVTLWAVVGLVCFIQDIAEVFRKAKP